MFNSKKGLFCIMNPLICEKGFYFSLNQMDIPKSLSAKGQWDQKSKSWLFKPLFYHNIIQDLKLTDELNVHQKVSFRMNVEFELRAYQKDAFEAWKRNGYRGVVVLPTGTGKSFLALKAIEELKERCLIVVPTLALVDQWYQLIKKKLGLSSEYIGLWIGGKKEAEKDIVISTYASAYRDIISLRKGRSLVIFDEVHHLPAESYMIAAEGMFSPFRMGLSATPERADEAHLLLDEIVGPQVFRKMPDDFDSKYLSDYEIKTLYVDMTSEERQKYDEKRAIFDGFIRANNIRGFGASILQRIIFMSGRNKEARDALKARQMMNKISANSQSKLKKLSELLEQHKNQKVIIFSQSTEMVERISFLFLIPCITYETQSHERKEILRKFKDGTYTKIVASSVLDEGIDVPDAAVGIILTGTAQPRQFIQRLGRILRPYYDLDTDSMKKATMYEIVCRGTNEVSHAKKRKEKLSKSRGG